MGAGLHHPALIEHDHPVGGRGLRQPVRHEQPRAPFEGPRCRVLQDPGAGAARVGGRLVEDRDRRVRQHEPCQGEVLRLGDRQPVPTLADHRGEAVGQRLRPVQGPDPVERRVQLLVAGLRPGEPQVVREGPGEDMHLLADERHRAADPGRSQLTGVDPAERDGATGGAVDAGDQLGQGGLAGPACAHERHAFPAAHPEVDLVQDRGP